MNYYQILNVLPIIIALEMAACQSGVSTTPVIPDDSISIDNDARHDDFCDYFYSKDTLSDTLHFNFEGRDDFGSVYLSEDELKQIYCEIKRGNVDAYELLYLHYFYSYSPSLPRTEMDKLICITDYMARKYSYYRGYLACGNIIFDHLRFHVDDDYYAATMIAYYEKYFEFSKSESIAKRLYEIYSGNYSFQDTDPVKAKYYEEFLFGK